MIVLLAVVIVTVVLVVALRPKPEGGATRPARVGRPTTADDLDRWVAAGLIARDQAVAIRDHEAALADVGPAPAESPTSRPPRVRSRVPVVAEAIGYLGGALALGGVVLVLADRWTDLTALTRLGLALAGALVFVVAGALTPATSDPALGRLRAFLWLLSSAATGVAAAVIVDDQALRGEVAVAWVAGAVALESGLLWWWRDRPVQQAVALAAAAVAVGTGATAGLGEVGGGLALWAFGGVELALGLTRRTPEPTLTDLAAALTLVAGPALVIGGAMSAGFLLLVGTVLGLLVLVAAAGTSLRTAERVALGVPAAFGALQGLPPALVHFAADGGLVTGLVVAAGGVLTIVAASRGWLRWRIVGEVVGAVAVVGGPALVAVQFSTAGPVLGVVAAVALLVVGTSTERLALSLVGALGLLAHVPWALAELFPGEARLPLLLAVVGAVLVAVAVVLTRQAGRIRHPRGPVPHPLG